MNRLCIAAVAGLIVCCSAFAAAEQPQEEKPNSKWEPWVQVPAAPITPKCDVKFDASNNPKPMPATADTLPIIGEKYFTKFTIFVPPDAFEFRRDNSSNDDERSLNDSERRVQSLFHAFTLQLHADAIGRSIESLPASVRPKRDMSPAFSSPLFGIGDLQALPGDNHSFLTMSVSAQLFTTSNGDPEVLVKALCDVYAYELSIPEQEEFIRQAKELVAEGVKLHQSIETRMAQRDVNKKQLASLSGFDDITPASLETFRSRRRMLDVDRAGLKARVDACEKILKEGSVSGATTQVESVKVAAEIELAGLEAKRAEIDRIVQGGQKRVDLQSKVRHEQESLEQLANRAQLAFRQANIAAEGARLWAKCPIQGVVHISPIKWEAPRENAGIRGAGG